MEVFGEEDFEHLFPLHDKLYTYEAFVVAAGLAPVYYLRPIPILF